VGGIFLTELNILYFKCHLPFELSTAGHIFSNVLRLLAT